MNVIEFRSPFPNGHRIQAMSRTIGHFPCLPVHYRGCMPHVFGTLLSISPQNITMDHPRWMVCKVSGLVKSNQMKQVFLATDGSFYLLLLRLSS